MKERGKGNFLNPSFYSESRCVKSEKTCSEMIETIVSWEKICGSMSLSYTFLILSSFSPTRNHNKNDEQVLNKKMQLFSLKSQVSHSKTILWYHLQRKVMEKSHGKLLPGSYKLLTQEVKTTRRRMFTRWLIVRVKPKGLPSEKSWTTPTFQLAIFIRKERKLDE